MTSEPGDDFSCDAYDPRDTEDVIDERSLVELLMKAHRDGLPADVLLFMLDNALLSDS